MDIKKHRNIKYTYGEVYETFAKRGYTLLDKEYGNTTTAEDLTEFKQRYQSGEFDEIEAIA